MALKKVYGLEVHEGLKVPKNSSVPSWAGTSEDQAKLFYSTMDNKVYVGANGSFKPIALESLIQSITVGSIAFFVGENLPAGWLQANGSVLGRTAYSDLWAFASGSGAIATEATWWAEYNAGGCGKFSSGNGSTDFRLPDLRGEFIRCWGQTRGIDPGRTVGSFQVNDVQLHEHYISFNAGVGVQVVGGGTNPFWPVVAGAAYTNSTGGAETRPRNVVLNAAIKY